MVIHLGSKSSKLEDMVFWYKVPVHKKDWRMCLDIFWQSPSSGGESVLFDDDGDAINQYTGKKNGLVVNVCKMDL